MDRIGHIGMIEMDMPSIQRPDEALIRVRAVGVCRSEVHALDGTHPFRRPPVLSGHEASGDIVAVGSGVSRFAEGDRVVLDHISVCGACGWCTSGNQNLCPAKQVMGTPEWPGAFGEYVVVPEQALFRLPDRLTYVEGALAEPLMIAVHVARRGNVRPGTSVAVLGTGSIGGLVVSVCSAWGATPIIGADVLEHPLTAARRLGATHTVLLPDDALVEKAIGVAGGDGVDVAVVTADDPSLVREAVAMVRTRGCVVLVAIMAGEPVCFDVYEAIRKEVTIVGSVMGTHDDMITAIDLARSGAVDVGVTAVPVLPIEEVARGIELARTKAQGAIKVVFSFD
jgi:L-iditol 2-dehydrogenase